MILDGTTESVVSPLYKEEILGLLYLNVCFVLILIDSTFHT